MSVISASCVGRTLDSCIAIDATVARVRGHRCRLPIYAATPTYLLRSVVRTYVRDRSRLALTRYRRALERRHIFGAEIAASEMGFLSLRDALGLLALYAAEDSPKFGKAATRWLGRLALESDDLSLHDFQLAAAALHALPRRPNSALHVLRDVSR